MLMMVNGVDVPAVADDDDELLTRIIRARAAMLAPRMTKASCVGSTLKW